jgi:nicotinate-nucleotide adenylyltransferase
MKVGLFFGSFNPIHNGHLAIAAYMVEHGDIDRLWFVVSPQNPLKEKDDLLDDTLRLQMVKLAIANDDHLGACDIELALPQPSFTINTLDALKTSFPAIEFRLIMGADNFVNLEKWKDYSRIISEYPILIYPRPGFAMKNSILKGNFTLINAPLLPISSTMIREKIGKNENIDSLIPSAVSEFIKSSSLYR